MLRFRPSETLCDVIRGTIRSLAIVRATTNHGLCEVHPFWRYRIVRCDVLVALLRSSQPTFQQLGRLPTRVEWSGETPRLPESPRKLIPAVQVDPGGHAHGSAKVTHMVPAAPLWIPKSGGRLAMTHLGHAISQVKHMLSCMYMVDGCIG